jgi:hypothetical protein
MRNNLIVFKKRLSYFYLINKVKVVFCINSISCYLTLIEAYRLVVLIVDEAAHIILLDIITLLGKVFAT